MQCPQCGKFFVEWDIYQKYCSLECYTKAQVDSLRIAPTTFNLYHNGEEVKRVDSFQYELPTLYPNRRIKS